jgi:hypothetical protein
MRRNIILVWIGFAVLTAGVCSRWWINRDKDSESPLEPSHSTKPILISQSSAPQALLPPGGLPSLPEIAREFRVLSTEEAAELEEMMRVFWATQDEEIRMDLLDQMEEGFYGQELAMFVEALFKRDPPVSEALLERALSVLAGNISASVLQAFEAAMTHPEESIRESAVLGVGQIRHTAMIPFLSGASNDDSPSVRASVFETLENQTETTRQEVLSRALKSRFEDTAVNALGELELNATHTTIPRLIEALNSPWIGVRDDARQTFELWFGETFDSTNAATTWWEKNHERYDSDLVEK